MNYTVTRIGCGLICTLACSLYNDRSIAAEPKMDDAKTKPVAEASNKFAINLYGKLSGEAKGNLFFSPSSISTALDMVYAGAKGETAKEMSHVLALGDRLSGDALHSAAGQLIRQLNAGGKQSAYQLTVANRLWGQKGFSFLDSFLKLIRDQYGAGLEQLDFKQAEVARAAINAWVEKATNEKIKDLIPKGAISGDTRLVLTNAVYFKGTWRDVFQKDATRPEMFSLSGSEKAEVPMMYQKKHHNYAEIKLENNKGAKILQLPYKVAPGGNDRGLSMVIVLPDDVDGMGNLERELSLDNLTKWIGDLKSAEVMTWLPKFKLTAQFQLNSALSDLGMPLAFDPQGADFSGMDGRRDLFLSAVFHKAFVDVNEEGTEAAAATGAVVGVMAMPVREEPKQFKADHPFLFLIRDETSGCILFMGRATDPRG